MATDALTIQESDERAAAERVKSISAASRLAGWLMPLASLKLTVALFAMAIFLIFAGTMAQVNQDIWEVMHKYFRAWVAWIDLQLFFPKSFFTGEAPNVPGRFPFPGGWLIGTAMGVNLLAAHALRFKTQARGARLLAGLGVIAVGVLLTWMVVLGGSGKDTIEGSATFEWPALWTAMKWCLVGLWLVGAYSVAQLDPARKVERWTLLIAEVILGTTLTWIFLRGEQAVLGDSSMRILWQLIKGGLAGLVLLAGCGLVFRKRAGIVLLHSGVALVMANELVVHNLHVEGQMRIRQGETVNYVYDVRAAELAVVEPVDANTEQVTVVPASLLKLEEPIRDERLPFDVEVIEYLPNSSLTALKPGDKNPATAGLGLEMKADRKRETTGTDMGGAVDIASAYVKLTDKQTHQPLGAYLLTTATDVMPDVPPQTLDVGGKKYELSLRFKRTYKPYEMTLREFRFDKYLGTQTAKNFSADVHLVDASRNVDRDVKIWMNNPLRFAGETFYQSSWFPDGDRQGTILQVVTNTGWMIPYVACMLVGTGMLAQFSVTLTRFLRRREDEQSAASKSSRRKAPRAAAAPGGLVAWSLPAIVVGICALWVVSSARQPAIPLSEMQLDEFGRLPLVYEGRVKPFDTVARNMLRYLSGKQTFVDETSATPRPNQPAIKWFLDVVERPKDAMKHKVFRIENLDVLETLGLERRSGFRYSMSEFSKRMDELKRQAELAADVEPAQLSIYQKKLMELEKKVRLVTLVGVSFSPPLNPQDGEEGLRAALRMLDALSRVSAPLAVPPRSADGEWESFAAAWFSGLKDRVRGQEPNPALGAMSTLLEAYGAGDAKAFNSELARYEKLLDTHRPNDFDPAKVSYEAFFNFFEPFYCALVLYVVAFVLVVVSWLGWTQPLNRAALCLLVFTLALHTFALGSRIYISGRPPVTNLYATAVFIGWGGVVLALILEWVYRLGLGSVIAAVIGFATLLIANFLAGLSDGDTLGVLQAVLDTQFWLATHVVCINLGYATTILAGLFGILYIVRGVFTPSLSPSVGKDLSRMIYGTLCFATFFSFIGTVLGGLWADDSWGRFWGWDPKENGALMIVLWNALVLHARWGGMVKERGLAALVVVGNIVTGWSWFGVNELGKGLHSYGFTEGVLMALGLFIVSQLAVIACGALPKHLWWSYRVRTT